MTNKNKINEEQTGIETNESWLRDTSSKQKLSDRIGYLQRGNNIDLSSRRKNENISAGLANVIKFELFE